jgi:DNA-binding MarR family transcriptional regulator
MQRMQEDPTDTDTDLPTRMLLSNALSTAWRLNYVANFYAVPFYAALQRELGMSRSEYVILFCVAQNPGITAQDVVKTTGRPKNSISVAVSRIESKRLISRRPSKSDARRMELHVTRSGYRMFEKVLPLLAARERRMVEVLSRSERRQFDALLMKIAVHVPAWAEPDLDALNG